MLQKLKKHKKAIFLSISAYLIITLSIYFYLISKTLDNNFNEIQFNISNDISHDSSTLDTNIFKKDINVENFPYEEYFKNSENGNIHLINNHIEQLNFLNGAEQEIIYNCYSIELQKKLKNPTSLDSLNMILNWVEQFKYGSSFYPNNTIVFESITLHWYNYLSLVLSEKVKNDNSLKYSFKFKSLQRRCLLNNTSIQIKDNKFDKAIYNLLEARYSYLIKRVWLINKWLIIIPLIVIFVFLALLILKKRKNEKKIQ